MDDRHITEPCRSCGEPHDGWMCESTYLTTNYGYEAWKVKVKQMWPTEGGA